jgi:ATP-dependent RNA helicase DDX27
MAMEADKEFGDSKVLNAAIRTAKKAARPEKIGNPPSKSPTQKSKVTSRRRSAFEQDLSGKRGRGEGIRAKKGDAIGGMGKRKGGKR